MNGCAFQDHFLPRMCQRWLEAAPGRFACRRFSAPPDVAQLSALHYLAPKAELPGVRLVFYTGGQPLLPRIPLFPAFEGVDHCLAVVVSGDEPDARLHAGIAGEAMELEMVALGLHSCWVMSFSRRRLAIDLKPGEQAVALIPFGVAEAAEGAVRRSRHPLKALCLDDPAGWPNWAFQTAEAMRGAPSAMNLQPWRFSFHGSTLRLGGSRFGGVDTGIAVLHAECALYAHPHQWKRGDDGKSLLVSLKEVPGEPV